MHTHHPERVRVLIAGDHAPSTDRIKGLVAPHFEVVATVRDIGNQALHHAALELKPDVILVNIAMAIEDRFEAVMEMVRQLPHTRFVFYQNEGGCRCCAAKVSPDAASALGGCGFVSNGQADCGTPGTRSTSARALQTSTTPSSQALTHREYEVLALLAVGHPMKRIAYRLGITYRTVTFHKYRMMERLGIKTNAGLMSYALKRNISENFEDNEAVVPA
jgi:DNA-binding NarL/FixJ family response regulator